MKLSWALPALLCGCEQGPEDPAATPEVVQSAVKADQPATDPGASATGDRRAGSLGTVEAAARPIGSDPTGDQTIVNGLPVEPALSLMVNDRAILSRFPLKDVMDQLVQQGGNASAGASLALIRQMWASLGTPQCTPGINGFLFVNCPRSAEQAQITEDPFNTSTTDQTLINQQYIPTALVNRVDLMPTDGGNCGEARIVYARREGASNQFRRAFLIFEAVLPNPGQGIEGCRPIQEFWLNLSSITDMNVRAERLRNFFFKGLPGHRPVVDVRNFGDAPQTGGRLRVNLFMQHAWNLREFKLKLNCSTGACTLNAVPASVKSTPHDSLFQDGTDPKRTAFQNYFMTQLTNLSGNVNALLLDTEHGQFQDAFNGPDSNSQGASFVNHLGPAFRQRILNALNSSGSTLTPENVVARANTQSCAGCHQISNEADLGNGVTWPRSGDFVHVHETVNLTTDRFAISPALTDVFLPHRRAVMTSYLGPFGPPNVLVRKVAAGGVVVDGNLNEPGWTLEREIGKAALGNTNNRGHWGVMWNEQFLFVGARVRDSSLRNDSTGVPDDDGVEIYLDGDNSGGPYGADDRQFIKGFSDTALFEKLGRIAGVQHAWAGSAGGYSVELAIPWSHLGLQPPAAGGSVIGLDIGFNDDDNGGARDTQAVWLGGSSSWMETSLFGNLELVATAADTALGAAKVATAPLVDGNLNEAFWTLKNQVHKRIIGASDHEVSYQAVWTSSALIVGAKVLDAQLVKDSTSVSDDDSFEIYVDGNNNGATSPAYDASDRQFIKRFNDTGLFEKAGRLTGVQHAWARIPGGFTVEISIPWSHFGITPSAGKTLGFDVAANDDDNGGTRDAQTMRSGTNNNWQSTAAFGKLTLLP